MNNAGEVKSNYCRKPHNVVGQFVISALNTTMLYITFHSMNATKVEKKVQENSSANIAI